MMKTLTVLTIALTAFAQTLPQKANRGFRSPLGQIPVKSEADSFNGYSGDAPITVATQGTATMNYRESWDHSDSLPVILADAIVRAKIAKVGSFLSTDQTTIFTELKAAVEAVISQGRSYHLAAGSLASIVMPGGAIILPNGKQVMRGCQSESIPKVNAEYILFLRWNKAANAFSLLAAFQTGAHSWMTHSVGKAEMLDEYGYGGDQNLLALIDTALSH